MNKFKLRNLVKTKPMKIQLFELINSQQSLKNLLEEKLPITLSYKLSLLLKKIRPELESYEKVRTDKIKELGSIVKDDAENDTNEYSLDINNKEVIEEFRKAMVDVGNQTIEIDIPEIKISEFNNSINLTPMDMETLSWFIKE